MARGGEDEQRRKRKKIWREKIFGDTDDQNQQSTNWVNMAMLNNQRQRNAIPIESNSHLRVNGRGQRTNIIKLPNAWKRILS